MMKLLSRATIVVAITGLLLTGCADPEPGLDGSTQQGGAEGTAVAVDKDFGLETNESIRNLLPQEILDRGYVTVAADIPYPPFAFLDEDGKTIIGADPDIGAALGQVLGIEFRFTPVAQANLIPGLSSGKYDIGMSGIADRVARQEFVTFIDYMENGGAFVITPTSEIQPKTLDDLCGVAVSVQSATTMATNATEQSAKCESEGKPPVTVNEFQGQDQVLLALSSNRVQVAILTAGSSAYMERISPDEFQVASIYNEPGKLGIAVQNGNEELIAAIEAAMKELFSNGTYKAILEEWGLYEHNSIDAVTINDAKDKPKG